MIKRIANYLGDPNNVRTLKKVLYVTLVVVFGADFLAYREHVAFIWDKIPGWSAAYGFVSCVLLIIVSKFLGHEWLYKEEDYYDD